VQWVNRDGRRKVFSRTRFDEVSGPRRSFSILPVGSDVAVIGYKHQAVLWIDGYPMWVAQLCLIPPERPKWFFIARRLLAIHHDLRRMLDGEVQFLSSFVYRNSVRPVWRVKFAVWTDVSARVAREHGHRIDRIVIHGIDVTALRVYIDSA